MKKLFVSVPMRGRTEEAIKASMAKMKAIAEAYEGEELKLINSYIPGNAPENVNQRIRYLGKSIEMMAEADVFIGVYNAYERYLGCDIEADVAHYYDVKSYRADIMDVCPDISNGNIDEMTAGETNVSL